MIITTKTNLHLWLLTGRCEDFVNAALNSGIRYLGSSPPPEVVVARDILKLSDTRSDFYVLGALAAASVSAPFLRRIPDDNGLAFAGDLLRLPAAVVTGATAVSSNAASWPVFDGSVAGRDGFTEVQVTKHGESVIVRCDNGAIKFAEYTISENSISVQALEAFGIHARFVVGGWSDGQSFTIKLPQTGYPYGKLAGLIAESSQAIQLMLETGTMEAFASAVRPIHKVGALVCAIMLRMAEISVAPGSEFSVEADTPQLEEYVLRQLSVDWAPIVLDSVPVTYNE